MADRTYGVGHVHVGKPVTERTIESVWECADNCPHPDHQDPGDTE